MTLGALITGFVGDKMGRRFTYQINLLIFGLASLPRPFRRTWTSSSSAASCRAWGSARKSSSAIRR